MIQSRTNILIHQERYNKPYGLDCNSNTCNETTQYQYNECIILYGMYHTVFRYYALGIYHQFKCQQGLPHSL